MKLIESKVEYLPQAEGMEGIYKQIELAGRTAYKSEDKITPTSAKDFVDRMFKSKHYAALEHGTIYLKREVDMQDDDYIVFETYFELNPYSKVSYDGAYCYVVTNLRAIVENHWEEELQYLCPPTEFHERRYTFRFTCSRAIAQELTRHRVFSFLMESQRYINYSKGRHGGEIAFIEPVAYNNWDSYLKNEFDRHLERTESLYMWMLEKDLQPQIARDVLPNATKTELVMTGFASDWRHLLDLRLFEKTGKVHPDMKDLMEKLKTAAEEASIWDDIMNKPSKFE